MDFKKFFHTFFSKLKEWWKKGVFQKTYRVTYDVFWNIILFFLVIGIVGLFFAGGVGAGYFASLVQDEEIRPKEEMEKDIYNYEETSELYFADNTFLGEVSSDIHREEIELNQVSEYVRNAIIATEDETFNSHNGVVPKAIFRAIFQEATNSAVKTGGSTLTQQLIKNQILTNEVSFERKAKEILLALRLENFFDKDEILEAYLNIVPFGRDANGRNIAGIQTAAKGIFGVDASELNLPQAAYIAGLPQSPSYYTPFQNGGKPKDEEGLEPGLNRMKTVLDRMLNAGYINEQQYQEAINYDVVANLADPTPSVNDEYPWLTVEVKERAQEIIAEVLAEQDGYTKEDLRDNQALQEEYSILAERSIGRNGYKIHTTIDKELYDIFQDMAAKFDNYGPDKNQILYDPETGEALIDPDTGEVVKEIEPVQVGSILIENKTGRILSFVGGRDFDIEQVNHATNGPRPNGSTMKPLLVYGPALEAGVVQPGGIIADVKTTYPIAGQEPYSPKNYVASRYYGLVSAREALYKSHNVSAVKVYTKIINDDPAKHYLERMGFTSLVPVDHGILSLPLGGITNGVTIEENTNAYATIGNGGKFVDAYMIEKIETLDGEVIYEHESKEVEVFSPQTNYLLLDMMRDVLTRGTATATQSYLNNTSVDWAGKTGTSNDWHDTWFVATNPNVTLGSWMGYDTPKVLADGYSNRNVHFWSELINAATEAKPELMAPSERFERPGGIVSRSYCATSGMLPSDLCNELGLVRTDLFNAKYVPTEEDDSLIQGKYVIVDGKAVLAGENTPDEFVENDGITFNPEWLKRMGYDKLDNIKDLLPSDSGPWSKIAIPSTETGTVEDDGKKPAVPTDVKNANGTLTWNKSNSNDVIGYRIYRANNPDASFKLIGNTTNTEFNISDGNAVYLIRSVDYFGLESGDSDKVVVGDFSDKPELDLPGLPNPMNPEPEDENSNGNSNNNDDGNGNRNNENGNNGNRDNNSSEEE